MRIIISKGLGGRQEYLIEPARKAHQPPILIQGEDAQAVKAEALKVIHEVASREFPGAVAG